MSSGLGDDHDYLQTPRQFGPSRRRRRVSAALGAPLPSTSGFAAGLSASNLLPPSSPAKPQGQSHGHNCLDVLAEAALIEYNRIKREESGASASTEASSTQSQSQCVQRWEMGFYESNSTPTSARHAQSPLVLAEAALIEYRRIKQEESGASASTDASSTHNQNAPTSLGPSSPPFQFSSPRSEPMTGHSQRKSPQPGTPAENAPRIPTPDCVAGRSQPASVTPQPVTATHQPAPATQQLAPATQQPAPATQQPAPVSQQPVPVSQQPVPVISQPPSVPSHPGLVHIQHVPPTPSSNQMSVAHAAAGTVQTHQIIAHPSGHHVVVPGNAPQIMPQHTVLQPVFDSNNNQAGSSGSPTILFYVPMPSQEQQQHKP